MLINENCARKVCLGIILAMGTVASIFADEGFSFGIKDFDLKSPISASFLNDHIAGSKGWVTKNDSGQLSIRGQRTRFFGLNCTFIPTKEQSVELARRLAALGVNIVRLHHFDAPWGDSLLGGYNARNSRTFDPQILDRLDFFASELFKNGIYLNLNLLTGRRFQSADGLPVSIDRVENFKTRHVPGFWSKPFLALQREYARNLLTHVNPYTKRAYNQEPGVAVVEVNNENGLVFAWLAGWVDQLPADITEDLRLGWQKLVQAQYGNDEKLSKTLGLSAPLGPEIITPIVQNGRVGSSWNLETHAGSIAQIQAQSDSSARLEISKPGSEDWHVQLTYGPFETKAETLYTLSFKVRSSQPPKGTLTVNVSMAHAPWQSLGLSQAVNVTGDWTEVSIPISRLTADKGARLVFGGLGKGTGRVEFKDISLKTGGNIAAGNGSLDRGTFQIPLFSQKARANPVLLDLWMQYLYSVESQYWSNWATYLRKDLSVKSLLSGTVMICSTPYLMENYDIVDSHAYWNHPHFPGVDWDTKNWYVNNTSLIRSSDGGTLTGLAFQRIKGKPYSVSEYDHPWPNQYGFESYLMLSTYASWQDWDMIYGFTIEKELPDQPVRIAGYFDQIGNPIKATAMPLAARIFRQFLVAPCSDVSTMTWSRAQEKSKLSDLEAWSIFGARTGGWNQALAKTKRIQIELGEKVSPSAKPVTSNQAATFVWQSEQGVYSVTTKSLQVQLRARAPFDSVSFGLGMKGQSDADLGAFVSLVEMSPIDGKTQIIVLNSRKAANDREALAEYAGPLTSTPAAAPDALALTKISTLLPGNTFAKLWTNEWSIDLPPGLQMSTIGARGQILETKNATASIRLTPADHSPWYVFRRP